MNRVAAGLLGLFFIATRSDAAPAALPSLADVSIEQHLGAGLPLDASFRDETGKAVKLSEYFGRRPVFLGFVYYKCPMLCTYVTTGVVRALRSMSFAAGKEFELVFVSVDPSDPPEMAAAKKEEFMGQYGRSGASRGVHFLTGEEPAIRKTAEIAGFRFEKDPETGGFSHAAGMMVATPQGTLSRYFYGIEYSPRDIKLSLMEASGGAVGSPVDRVLLYCSHYDPTTGKYGVAILRVVRLAGAATALALAGFLVVMFRREARTRREAAPS